jgi:hypothetical protein
MLTTAAGNLASAQLLLAAGANPFLYGSCAFEVALLTGRLQFLWPYWAALPPRRDWDLSGIFFAATDLYAAPLWLPLVYLPTNISGVRKPGLTIIKQCDVFGSVIVYANQGFPRLISSYPYLRVVSGVLLSCAVPSIGTAVSLPLSVYSSSMLVWLICFALAFLRLLLSVPLRRALWSRRVRPGCVWQVLEASELWFMSPDVKPRWDA